jgi:hypothetical protein
VGDGSIGSAEVPDARTLGVPQGNGLGRFWGWDTSIYFRDIAHFLGAWLPDDPNSGEGARQRRRWITSSIYSYIVDLYYGARASIDGNGDVPDR